MRKAILAVAVAGALGAIGLAAAPAQAQSDGTEATNLPPSYFPGPGGYAYPYYSTPYYAPRYSYPRTAYTYPPRYYYSAPAYPAPAYYPPPRVATYPYYCNPYDVPRPGVNTACWY